MLDGVSDTSGAILLFGVWPFAEKIPDEISILQTSCTLDRGPPSPGSVFRQYGSFQRGWEWLKHELCEIPQFQACNGGLVVEVNSNGASTRYKSPIVYGVEERCPRSNDEIGYALACRKVKSRVGSFRYSR